MKDDQGDNLHDVTTVAKRLSFARQRIYQLLGENKFPNAQKVGDVWIIPERDVLAFEAGRVATNESDGAK